VHGNGNSHVVLEDLRVRDFEVTGIQFNGGDNIAVLQSKVGPAASEDVPSHKVSHALFTSLYTHRYLPGGLYHLAMKGECYILLASAVSPQGMVEVFRRSMRVALLQECAFN
jgi:hypothetical protein